MIRKHSKKVVIFLATFIIIAFSYFGLEYLEKEIESIIAEELSKLAYNSCECEFDFEKINFSILKLNAKITSPELLRNNTKKISFKSATVDVSLNKIFDYEILLSNLRLNKGVVVNFDSESVLFKLIDELTTENPDKKSPWKIRVDGIYVIDTALTHDLDNLFLDFKKVSVSINRNENGLFELRPFIGSFDLISKEDNQIIVPMTSISSVVTLNEDYIGFSKLNWRTGFTRSNGGNLKYIKSNENLEGEINFLLDPRDVGLPDFIKGKFEGMASLKGHWSEPLISGDIKSSKTNVPKIAVGDYKFVNFENLVSNFKVNWLDGNPVFNLYKLDSKEASINLDIEEKIVVSSEKISGLLSLKTKSIVSKDIEVKNAFATLKLQGDLSSPKIEINGLLDNFLYKDIILSKYNFSFSKTIKGILFNLFKANNKAEIFLSLLGEYKEEQTNLETNIFNLPFTLKNSKEGDLFFAKGAGSLNFSNNQDYLTGKGTTFITSNFLSSASSFNINYTLENNNVILEILNNSETIDAKLSLPLNNKKGSAKVKFSDFSINEYYSPLKCSNFNGAIEYNFFKDKPLLGDGFLSFDYSTLGCKPYDFSLLDGKTISIKNGVIILNNLVAKGKFGNAELNGKVDLNKGYNLKAKTSIKLQSLTSLISFIDDLRGRGDGEIRLTGELAKPIVNGNFSLSNSSFYIEAFKTNAENLNGSFELVNNQINILDFNGDINKGKFSANGVYNLNDSYKTNLNFDFEKVQIEPFENAQAKFSGSLIFETNDLGKPEIGGDLFVDSAIWEQYLNINTLIDSVSEMFLYEKDESLSLLNLPKVFLDINLNAKRDVLALTNFLEVELSAALKIGGELSRPKIYGNLSTLAGWLGYKDKRFDITSGLLNFNPGDLVPNIDLIAETILDTATGESILTILQVKGSLINPVIKLTTDNNLAQDEILTLLAISQRDNFATRVNTINNVNNSLGLSLFNQSKESDFIKKFLHDLTKFDTLAIEPTANVRSGLIVPTFVAEKYLNDNVTLRGESNLSSDTPGSKVFLDYNLDEHLKLRTGIDTETVQEETSLLADISYTLFAKKFDFLNINVNGNIALSKYDLLNRSRISKNSRIEFSGVKDLETLIENIYKQEAYFDSEVKIDCKIEANYKRVQYCRELTININSGEKYNVEEIVFLKDKLPVELKAKNFSLKENQSATQKYLTVYRQKLISSLRNEGYIKARLSVAYKVDSDKKNVVLEVSLIKGNPVSFVFKGNTIFSAEDFLKTINLFERKEPFGNNTINILIQRIEKLYRDLGHLFASISYKLYNLPNINRQQYVITIDEGRSIPVGEVVFQGITDKDLEKLTNAIRADYKTRYDQIFKPNFVKAENLLTNIIILRQIFNFDGFPYADIKYKLDIDSSLNKINIIYQFNKGKAYNADWLRLSNFPKEIELPDKPLAPYSIPKANDYVEKLIVLLEENAYYNASFYSELDIGEKLVIHFEPGERTRINNINITGNNNIDSALIKSKISFGKNDLLLKNEISESRRNLLSLGLFSRVVIEADDGVVDSLNENISIEVLERPLQSIQFGGGLHSELGFHAFGEIVNKGIFLDGRSLTFRADTYYDPDQNDISQGIISLALKQPRAFDLNFDLNHSIRYQKIDLTTFEFDLDRFIIDTSLFRRIDQNFRFNFGLSLLQESLDNVPTDVVITNQDIGSATLGFLNLGLFYDKRDNPINPESGYQVFLEADLATPALLSDASYLSISSGISSVFTLSSKFQLANRLSSSIGYTFDDESSLPISQRFYAGGRTSVRGFRENSLGPKTDDGNVIGGDFLLVNNFELRYRLTQNVQLHTFLDSGNVFLQDIEIDLNELRHSAGIGFRYISPIGPIGFDLGHPLDRQEGESAYRVHFSVGSRF